MIELNKYETEDCIRVGDLIEVLKNYDPHMICLFSWESVFHQFKLDNVYKGNHDILIFDADDNSYKEQFENKILIKD